MSDLLTELTEDSFEQEVANSSVPVIVDFWAPWCPPCKAIVSVLAEIAKEYEGRLAIRKVNVDECPHLAAKFEIRGIPALIFFKKGEIVEKLVGSLPKSSIVSTINSKLMS